jgi:hypothetical protein
MLLVAIFLNHTSGSVDWGRWTDAGLSGTNVAVEVAHEDVPQNVWGSLFKLSGDIQEGPRFS